MRPAMLLAALLVLSASTAAAQSLSGTVLAVESGDSIEGARVMLRNSSGDLLSQTLSDATGAFFLAVPRPGDYLVDVTHDAWAAVEPVAVTVGDGEAVIIEVRLSRSLVRMEALTVTARRRDPRHDATFEGALERYRQYPTLGSRRVMMPDDVELRSATRVGDALRHLPRGGSCMIVYSNGVLVHNEEWLEGWLETSAVNLDALEFYRTYADAPQSYRGFPTYVLSPHDCSVLALWTMQEDRPPKSHGWLRFLGAAGLLLVLIVTTN